MYVKGIYRQMGLLKKPSYMKKEEFKNWLLNVHAENGKYLPNLKRYSFYITLDSIPDLNPPAYDAYAESWFGSLDEFKEAYDSEVMKGQIEDVKAQYKGEENRLVQVILAEEYNIIVPDGFKSIPQKKNMFCQMGHIKQPPHMSRQDLKDWWLNIHAETGKYVEDLKWYTVCFTIDGTLLGHPFFDGYGEIWFDSYEALKASFKSNIMKGQFEDVKKHKMNDPALHKVVVAEQYLIDLPN